MRLRDADPDRTRAWEFVGAADSGVSDAIRQELATNVPNSQTAVVETLSSDEVGQWSEQIVNRVKPRSHPGYSSPAPAVGPHLKNLAPPIDE